MPGWQLRKEHEKGGREARLFVFIRSNLDPGSRWKSGSGGAELFAGDGQEFVHLAAHFALASGEARAFQVA
jgi:hypothetical protein